MSDALIVEVINHVATISNNDAPYNRMTLEYMDELEALIPALGADPEVRALIFTAAGTEHFSVGMNLKQFPEGVKRKGSSDAVLDQRLDTVIGFESRSLAESIQDERAAVHATRGTADSQEGMRAFMEKRKPVFNQPAAPKTHT